MSHTKNVKRLFAQFAPTHYQLDLSIDEPNSKFSGKVTIAGSKTGPPTQRLTFHQNQLRISKASILKHERGKDTPISTKRINLQRSYDEVRLHSNDKLYPGKYTVTMEFEGKITKSMNGVYPCSFRHEGKDKQLIATQFESHHAREVFPCIDEPEAKAVFDLSITTATGQTVLSNTPIKQQEQLTTTKDRTRTTFETTPKMPTYLLAFVVGEMAYKQAKTKNGVVVRTYATPDNSQFTDFALEVAVQCLELYNDYFGIDYPLSKCDLIALPDFASGAMENWGCITFREQCMLVDPKNTSLHTKQYVAMVVAHELAHQWFGNLVTMRWWTDLWLNEGFASWIEYLAIDRLFPSWQMWTQFITDEQQSALRLDSLEHTHPVEVPVRHPDEIRTIFDAISYNKGASVIHMLNEYLGPEMFRDGLRHYLRKHEYNNTDTVDLWQSLEEVSAKPVKKFMNAWTSQAGFPLLQATVTDQQVSVKQTRFFINHDNAPAEQTTWPIPLKAGKQLAEVVLDKDRSEWSLREDTARLKFNLGQSSFYRTAYNSSHLKQLGEAVQNGHFGPLDRLGILSDAFETSKTKHADTADALDLLAFYANEDDSAVWDVISSSLLSIRGAMDDEELRQDMKPFIRKLVATQLERLGWQEKDSETHFDKLLRPTILGLAAGADQKNVVDECLRRFDSLTKPEDIPPDLRSVVYNTAARRGNQKTFDKLLKMHSSTTLSEQRTTLAAAITGFRQKAINKKALQLIKTDAVRKQDVGFWVAYSFMNRYSKHATWDWLKENWHWLEENLGSDLSFYRFPIYAARSFSDKKFMRDYQSFFEPVLTPSMERPYKQGLEIIQWQSSWKARELDTIKTFFRNKSKHS